MSADLLETLVPFSFQFGNYRFRLHYFVKLYSFVVELYPGIRVLCVLIERKRPRLSMVIVLSSIPISWNNLQVGRLVQTTKTYGCCVIDCKLDAKSFSHSGCMEVDLIDYPVLLIS